MTDLPIDPRSPFVLNIRELDRRAGSMRPIARSIAAPAGFGGDMLAVPPDTELELDARVESVVEGVVLTGTVRTRLRGECSRCLDEIVEDITVDICELYAYPDTGPAGTPGSTTDQTSDADELSRVQDEMIDGEPAIRDAVLLAIPVTPLCRDDCPGLCVGCGEHRDRLPADHAHDQGDIRWAALSDLGKRLAADTSVGGATPAPNSAAPKPSSAVVSPNLEQEN